MRPIAGPRFGYFGTWVLGYFLGLPELEAWSLLFDSHNGRVFKSAVILACALVGLAGCSTPARRQAKRNQPPPDWELSSNSQRSSPVVATNTPPPPPTANAAAASKPKANPPTFNAPETTWLSLNRWARDHGLESLRRTALAPVQGFALPTRNGVLTLRPGSLSAGWDGREFRLGFAPQLIDGQLFLHALDLRKHVEPLVHLSAPLATTGKVIVLDPGHGGSDPGTRSSADGRHEKTLGQAGHAPGRRPPDSEAWASPS